jgi:hypothetical protein
MDDSQRQARSEWRHLCETLENAQAQDLIRSCKDKCQFIQTFRTYGNGFGRLSSTLRELAKVGEYRFFCERGMPRGTMTPAFADLLLADWKSAIEGKKELVREMFRFRYHENLEPCTRSRHDMERIEVAQTLHQQDAVLALSTMVHPKVTFEEIDELRGEIAELRVQLEQLSVFAQNELAVLRCLLPPAPDH